MCVPVPVPVADGDPAPSVHSVAIFVGKWMFVFHTLVNLRRSTYPAAAAAGVLLRAVSSFVRSCCGLILSQHVSLPPEAWAVIYVKRKKRNLRLGSLILPRVPSEILGHQQQ